MSTQITVTLPDDLVAFIDETIQVSHLNSREDVIVQALRRERYRLRAEEDVRIYAATTAPRHTGPH